MSSIRRNPYYAGSFYRVSPSFRRRRWQRWWLSSDGDERNLFQIRVMLIFVGAALRRRNLLDGCARRRHTAKIFHIHFVKCPHVRQIIEVNSRGHNLAEIHVNFLEIVHEVAHRLTELDGGSRAIDSAVPSGYKTALRGTIQRVAGKDAGASRRAGGHVPGTNGAPFAQVTDRNARELDLSAAGQARDLDRGPCRSIAELETARIVLK
jgi:hypothetical protein